MARIKVLHIMAALDGGGVENTIMSIYRLINKNDIVFDFAVSSNQKGILEDEAMSYGSHIYHLGSKHKSIIRYYKQFVSLLESGEYDIVHCHQAEKGGLIYPITKLFGKKCIMHSHVCSLNDTRKQKIKRSILLALTYYYADIHLACSIASADQTYGKKAKEAHVFNNAFSEERFQFSNDHRVSIRNELGFGENIVVGLIGRLSKEKNHYFLMNVFYQALERNPRLRMVFIGDGPEKEDIENTIDSLNLNDKVLLLGNKSDVHRYYSAIDLFAMPSLSEGFGMALVEAQINGLSCLISENISNEAVLDPNLVKRIKLSDFETWKRELITCDIRICKEKHNLELFKEYDSETQMKRLMSIYTEILR